MEGDGRENADTIRLDISIHSLRMEGDRIGSGLADSLRISIHSLRMEGDNARSRVVNMDFVFQSTPSAWRETSCQK